MRWKNLHIIWLPRRLGQVLSLFRYQKHLQSKPTSTAALLMKSIRLTCSNLEFASLVRVRARFPQLDKWRGGDAVQSSECTLCIKAFPASLARLIVSKQMGLVVEVEPNSVQFLAREGSADFGRLLAHVQLLPRAAPSSSAKSKAWADTKIEIVYAIEEAHALSDGELTRGLALSLPIAIGQDLPALQQSGAPRLSHFGDGMYIAAAIVEAEKRLGATLVAAIAFKRIAVVLADQCATVEVDECATMFKPFDIDDVPDDASVNATLAERSLFASGERPVSAFVLPRSAHVSLLGRVNVFERQRYGEAKELLPVMAHYWRAVNNVMLPPAYDLNRVDAESAIIMNARFPFGSGIFVFPLACIQSEPIQRLARKRPSAEKSSGAAGAADFATLLCKVSQALEYLLSMVAVSHGVSETDASIPSLSSTVSAAAAGASECGLFQSANTHVPGIPSLAPSAFVAAVATRTLKRAFEPSAAIAAKFIPPSLPLAPELPRAAHISAPAPKILPAPPPAAMAAAVVPSLALPLAPQKKAKAAAPKKPASAKKSASSAPKKK